jgi:hypothetical protein
VLCLSIASAASAAADSEWRSIPLIENGKIASDWKYVGWGSMTVDKDQVATAPDERGLGLLLYTREKLGNCRIRVVYHPQNRRSNAGVFVRVDDGVLAWVGKESLAVRRDAKGKLAPDMLAKMRQASETEQGAWYAVHHGYEVQLCDTGDPLHRTGAVYSLASSSFVPPEKPTEAWRVMIITLDRGLVRVEQDGELLTVFDPDGKVPERKQWHEPRRDVARPESGYIGLQIHDPGDVVYFREVSVAPLK